MYAPGVTLSDRYRLEERIGGGGMGEVWRGTDEVLGRTIAVKIMLPSLVREPGFAQRFLTEARAMASINHPGVVDIHDYRSDEAGAFLVMEYVPGESLAQLLRREGALPPARVMAMMAQAAEALAAVHAKGIVHRDLKPGNLLVRTDGTMMLTDFGIARSPEANQLTATGAVIGTASYLSPEQALGRPAGPESDIYALGVVAYQCLRGEPPFDGDSPIQVAMKHVREEPPPLPATIPASVRAVVTKALAKDPEQRWRSATEFAAAARAAADPASRAGSAGPAPAVAPTRVPSITAPTYIPESPPTPRPGRATPPPRPAAAARPTTPPPPPGISPRPTWSKRVSPPATVTIASLLLLVAAAGFGVHFLAFMSVYDTIDRVWRETYADSDQPHLGALMAGVNLAMASAVLLFGFVLLLLAWRVYRGGRTARGWTIALTLLSLSCCGSVLLFGQAAGGNVGSNHADQYRASAQYQLEQELPAWVDLIANTTVLLGLGALTLATVLLITGPSNRYFRARGPVVLHPYSYHPYRPR